MSSPLIAAVEVISAVATLGLVYSTLKPCRASGVSYLLGIPTGFGLMAVAFATNAVISLMTASLLGLGLLLGVFFVLTQTYGMLFLALTYARRTRLRLLGESTPLELAVPSVVTVGVLFYVLTPHANFDLSAAPVPIDLTLRVVMAICAFYLVYETERSWSLTKRPSEGLVVIAFALFLLEQLGLVLFEISPGDVALFLGYEGRIVGLLMLVAITFWGVRKGDARTVVKRLGLVAPAHDVAASFSR
jgi:hypothetical protein